MLPGDNDGRSLSFAFFDNSLDAVKNLQFTDAGLNEIDRYAQEGAVDLWRNAREGARSEYNSVK
jgi:hypothetical protein